MMNPVLRKEAITTMRSWKTYGALVLFLVISAVGAMLYIDLSMFQNRDLSFDPSAMVWLYVVLAAVQMGLVLLTAPAVAAGSIRGAGTADIGSAAGDKNEPSFHCAGKTGILFDVCDAAGGGNIAHFRHCFLLRRCIGGAGGGSICFRAGDSLHGRQCFCIFLLPV